MNFEMTAPYGVTEVELDAMMASGIDAATRLIWMQWECDVTCAFADEYRPHIEAGLR